MKSSLTRSEYMKWLSYYKYKSPDINEIQMAILMSITARQAGSKDSKADDFILSYVADTKPASQEMDATEVGNFFAGML